MSSIGKWVVDQTSAGPEALTFFAVGIIILKNTEDLKKAGLIEPMDSKELEKVAAKFSISVTPTIYKAITDESGEAIFSQYIPSSDELTVSADELKDPIGDETYAPVKGITHRYPDRLLLKPIHTCAVYCRFCFRRETVGRSDGALNSKELNQAFDYIENNESVWEVILSGGDPLVMSPAKLAAIIKRLDAIDHVKVVRIHTRVPLAAPEKINEQLLHSLKMDKALFVVIHCNSHEELRPECTTAIREIISKGIPVLSQSVLLRGINDDPQLLEKLFRSLVENRVKPYYLHHADKAAGTSHFRTTIKEGQSLMRKLRGQLSGLCLPTYVLDIPGGQGKVPVGPQFLKFSKDQYKVNDWRGCSHVYKD